jgi:hypothetical protein
LNFNIEKRGKARGAREEKYKEIFFLFFFFFF